MLLGAAVPTYSLCATVLPEEQAGAGSIVPTTDTTSVLTPLPRAGDMSGTSLQVTPALPLGHALPCTISAWAGTHRIIPKTAHLRSQR